MESVRIFLTLRKYLQEVPDEILLMIVATYSTPEDLHLCACCGKDKDEVIKSSRWGDVEIEKWKKKEQTDYLAYVQNSKKFFGEKSWEICIKCRVNVLNYCPWCWLPYSDDICLFRTTCINEEDHFERCKKDDKYHIKHILGYDPNEGKNDEELEYM